MQVEHDPLQNRIRETPFSCTGGGDRIRGFLAGLQGGQPRDALRDALAPGQLARRLIEGVFDGSPFLMQLAARYPAMFADCLLKSPEAVFDTVISTANAAAAQTLDLREVMAALRHARSHLALLSGLADLAGIWDVETVTQRLSAAADAFVSAAVDCLLRRGINSGLWRPSDSRSPSHESGLIIIAMGKFGAEELNYSSDIDLVVFFDPEIVKDRVKGPAQTFFVRLVRDLVHILQERTADGYVFRTDLRLRPDPASTQAAMSTTSAYRYYETLGQNWERAAYIKSRPVAGDLAAGWTFLRGLEPYVWRKYLDYNAVADIHAMKRQIHAEKGHAHIAVAGHNVKLGRGGIREIEFFVQSQQLIGGGRQPSLRPRKTLDALERLYEFEWIGNDVRMELGDAYRFLRRTEHRLQMIADQQTHTLPGGQAELERFSRFCAFETFPDFERALRGSMQNVQRHYAGLFEHAPDGLLHKTSGNLVFTGDADDPGTVQTLIDLGFKNPASVIALIKGWHFGRYRAMRSVRAREILTEFTPAFLKALGETGDPDFALSTFDRFLSELPAAVQLFSLLRSNPDLLKLLARIMGSAPRLARALSQRSNLLDAILDPSALSLELSRDDMRDFLERELDAAGTYDKQLDRARVLGQEQSFFIGVSLLTGRLTPKEAGRSYSLLAETLIAAMLNSVQKEFGANFAPPAVLAMGKLGGREMTATSDLDLIVIYDDGGASASQHYARFTQRLIAALSAPTPQGMLYAVDMRLRPSGKAGPVAVSFDGFRSYQHHQAWTWEHLALTRARPVAGPKPLRDALQAEISSVLSLPRDRAKAGADVREMRALIMKEKRGDRLWDIKSHAGGLVDVEFIAQFLQIVAASPFAAGSVSLEGDGKSSVCDQNTQTALEKLVAAGLLAQSDGAILINAVGLYETINQILRLCTDGRFEPQTERRDLTDLILERTGENNLLDLEMRLNETYGQVADTFARIVV